MFDAPSVSVCVVLVWKLFTNTFSTPEKVTAEVVVPAFAAAPETEILTVSVPAPALKLSPALIVVPVALSPATTPLYESLPVPPVNEAPVSALAVSDQVRSESLT